MLAMDHIRPIRVSRPPHAHATRDRPFLLPLSAPRSTPVFPRRLCGTYLYVQLIATYGQILVGPHLKSSVLNMAAAYLVISCESPSRNMPDKSCETRQLEAKIDRRSERGWDGGGILLQASDSPVNIAHGTVVRQVTPAAAALDEDRSLFIAGRRIADDEPAYLIAEIGHNHGGSVERAMQMVSTAIAAGADAVKFQTRVPRDVYAPGSHPGAYEFRSDNPNWMDELYGVHREILEFSSDQWAELFSYCREKSITAFSTPFDLKSVDLLAKHGVPAIKIASGDATNTPLIHHAAQVGVPLIISTGG